MPFDLPVFQPADPAPDVPAALPLVVLLTGFTDAGGAVAQTVVEMERGLMLIMAISDGSCLAVLAAAESDLGMVASEMTLLVERAGRALTPTAHTSGIH